MKDYDPVDRNAKRKRQIREPLLASVELSGRRGGNLARRAYAATLAGADAV